MFNLQSVLAETLPASIGATYVAEADLIVGATMQLPEPFDFVLAQGDTGFDSLHAVQAELDMQMCEVHLEVVDRCEAAFHAIAEVVQIQIDNGGLDSAMFRSIELQQEAAACHFGGATVLDTPNAKTEVTHESFNDVGMRLTNSEVTHERIRERLANIGRTIMGLVDRMMDTWYSFMDTYVAKFGRVISDLTTLEAAAAGAKGKEAEKFLSPSGYRALLDYSGKKVVKSAEFTRVGKLVKAFGKDKGVDIIIEQISVLANEAKIEEPGQAKGIADTLEGLLRQFDAAIIGAVEANIDLGQLDSKELKRLGFGKHRGSQQDTAFEKFMVTETLPGSQAIYVAVPKAGSRMTVSVVVADANKRLSQVAEVPALSASEAASLCRDVLGMMKNVPDAVDGSRKTAKAFKNMVKGVKNLDELMKDQVRADAQADVERIKSFIKEIKKIATTVTSVNRLMVTYTTSIGAAAANYANASIKNLKEA